MLRKPGEYDNRPKQGRSSTRRSTPENPEDAIRKMQRMQSNKKCADCPAKVRHFLFTYFVYIDLIWKFTQFLILFVFFHISPLVPTSCEFDTWHICMHALCRCSVSTLSYNNIMIGIILPCNRWYGSSHLQYLFFLSLPKFIYFLVVVSLVTRSKVLENLILPQKKLIFYVRQVGMTL